MLDLDINKVKKLPFKEIMEIINANNGFFYNENSKKKLNRYAREVSRRTFTEARGNPREAARIAGYSDHSYPKVVRNLKKEITELAETHLINTLCQAATRLTDLLDEDGTTPHSNIRLAAANSVLDRVGIVKKRSIRYKYESYARNIYITS